MKNKIAIFALLLVCVLTLAACHKKTSGSTTNNTQTTLPPTASTTEAKTEVVLKNEGHEHENNGFVCLECGEEFVSQNDLLSFIGDVATEGYVIKTENITLIDDWYTSTIDVVELTVKADQVAVKVNATLSSEYFEKDLTLKAEGLYEEGYIYFEGEGIAELFSFLNLRDEIDEEDFDGVASAKVKLSDIIEESDELVEIAGAAELAQMLLNNLEKYANAIEAAAKLVNTESLKILSNHLHTIVLTLLENTGSFTKTDNGFKYALDFARAIEYANSLSGKTVGDVLGISLIDKGIIEGAIVGVLSLPVKPFLDLIPVNEIAADIEKFAEENNLDEDILAAVAMGKEMFNQYYEQLKDLTIIDLVNMALASGETEEGEEMEETEELTALKIAQIAVSAFDFEIPEFEIPELPEGFEVAIAITTDKFLEPTGIEISAMGYALSATAKANSTVDKEALKGIAFGLPEDYVEVYCTAYVEEMNAREYSNEVYELILDEAEKVIGYRSIYEGTGSWWYATEEGGDNVNFAFVEIEEYYFNEAIVVAKLEVCNGVNYEIYCEKKESTTVTEEDLAKVRLVLTDEDYEDFLENYSYEESESRMTEISIVTTEEGTTYVDYVEHDAVPEVDGEGNAVTTTSEDGVVETTKYTCKVCGKVYNYYYNVTMND